MNYPTQKCNIFLTLKCNFRCWYCVTKHDPRHDFQYQLEPGSRWIPAINGMRNIDYLAFIGGQPTLHPDFAEIVNAVDLPNVTKIAIATNGSRQAAEVLVKIKPRPNLHIQFSFHQSEISAEEHLEAVLRVKAVHQDVATHMVGTKNYDSHSKLFEQHGAPLSAQGMIGRMADGVTIKPDNMASRCNLKPHPPMLCAAPLYPLTAPSGDIYFCHSLMYLRGRCGIIGNLLDGWSVNPTEMVCPMVGFCNPCDDGHSLKPLN